MREQSIRVLTKVDVEYLEMIMGFGKGTLSKFDYRFVKIILDSPKVIKGISGREYYNEKRDMKQI